MAAPLAASAIDSSVFIRTFKLAMQGKSSEFMERAFERVTEMVRDACDAAGATADDKCHMVDLMRGQLVEHCIAEGIARKDDDACFFCITPIMTWAGYKRIEPRVSDAPGSIFKHVDDCLWSDIMATRLDGSPIAGVHFNMDGSTYMTKCMYSGKSFLSILYFDPLYCEDVIRCKKDINDTDIRMVERAMSYGAEADAHAVE